MIIVRLFGGLGNQMFQYALGRRIAHENNTILKLDKISGFRGDFYKRRYNLSNFNIIENFADKNDLPKFRLRHTESDKLSGKLIRFINKNIPFNRKYEIYEKTINYDPDILKSYSKAYFIGYWQNEKYFRSIENIIRNDFTIKNPPEGKNMEYAEDICSSQSVGVHIRNYSDVSNGYVLDSHKKIYSDISSNYYLDAINYIAKNYDNIKIYVFSDSPELAQKNFKGNFPIKFVTHNADNKNYEDLRLLSLCKHQIIANSTFSWWAAWLNKNKNKIIIAPSKWYNNPSRDTSSLIPQSWIRL